MINESNDNSTNVTDVTPKVAFHETVLFTDANAAYRAFIDKPANQLRFGGSEKQRQTKSERFSRAVVQFFMYLNSDMNEYYTSQEFLKVFKPTLEKALDNFSAKNNALIGRLDHLLRQNVDDAPFFIAAHYVKVKSKMQDAAYLFFDLALLEVLEKQKKTYLIAEIIERTPFSPVNREAAEANEVIGGVYKAMLDAYIGVNELLVLKPVQHYVSLAREYGAEVDTRVASYLNSLGVPKQSAENKATWAEDVATMPEPTVVKEAPKKPVKRFAETAKLRWNANYLNDVEAALFDELTGRRPLTIKGKVDMQMTGLRGQAGLERATGAVRTMLVKETLKTDAYSQHVLARVKRKTSGEAIEEMDDEGRAIMRKMMGLPSDEALPVKELFGRPFLLIGVPEDFPEELEGDEEDGPGTISQAFGKTKERVSGWFSGKGFGFGSK